MSIASTQKSDSLFVSRWRVCILGESSVVYVKCSTPIFNPEIKITLCVEENMISKQEVDASFTSQSEIYCN